MAMRFTQDFIKDFGQLDFNGEPFALARFGDGERGFCMGRPTPCCDGWYYDGSDTPYALKLRETVRADLPGYYIGISCPCCDPESHKWYLENVRAPLWRVTYANIFVNGNYKRTKKLLKRLFRTGVALVSSKGGDYTVPENAINPEFDYSGLLEELFRVDRPILVAAGPLANILVYEYWRLAPRKQTIVDIGSVLDRKIQGRRTRGYQKLLSSKLRRICVWS